jgi:hypothetical protein
VEIQCAECGDLEYLRLMDEHGDGVALSTSYFPSPRSPFDGVRRQRPAKLHPPPPSHRRGSVLAPARPRTANTKVLVAFAKGVEQAVIPKMSQETLAEMIGTTRSRVSVFMNRFRKLGFIHYDGGRGLQVHSALLNIILHD